MAEIDYKSSFLFGEIKNNLYINRISTYTFTTIIQLYKNLKGITGS